MRLRVTSQKISHLPREFLILGMGKSKSAQNIFYFKREWLRIDFKGADNEITLLRYKML